MKKGFTINDLISDALIIMLILVVLYARFGTDVYEEKCNCQKQCEEWYYNYNNEWTLINLTQETNKTTWSIDTNGRIR